MENPNTSSWFNSTNGILQDLGNDLFNNNYEFDFSDPNGANANGTNVNTNSDPNNYNGAFDNFSADGFNNEAAIAVETMGWDDMLLEPTSVGASVNQAGMIDLDKNQMADNDDNRMVETQKKLEEALRKQEELNRKLEEQLQLSQMENKRLHSSEQTSSARMDPVQTNNSRPRVMLGDITSTSRLNSTPSKMLKGKQQAFSNSTSAMKNENFSFLGKAPKPIFQQPMFLENTSSSNTSVNGSPRRRHNRSRSMASRDRDQRTRMSLSSGRNAKVEMVDASLGSSLQSPIKSPYIPDSPYRGDQVSNMSRGLQSPVIGMGISVDDSRRGSVSVLEHIKTRNSSTDNSMSPSVSPIRAPNFKYPEATPNRRRGSAVGKTLFTNGSVSTPNLGPPTLDSPADSISTSPVIEEESGSRLGTGQSPSPMLITQGVFDGQSPQIGGYAGELELRLSASPQKITRKLTTLPRGSIDRYVSELPDKTFICLYPDCHKSFKRRYNVRSHIQTHLEDRPYKCDHEGCDKAFVRNHDLVRHKKSHEEKRYACPCGKKFNREDALIVHRSRLICIGGKKFEGVVIKRSPRKRGRPRKDAPPIENMSPTKKADIPKERSLPQTSSSSPGDVVNPSLKLNSVPYLDLQDNIPTDDSFLNQLESELRMTMGEDNLM